MKRIPIVYISGRYRHYTDYTDPYPTYDQLRMQKELENETLFASLVLRLGGGVIAPLWNSAHIETWDSDIPNSAYLDADCAIIERLRPHDDILLLRPGWHAIEDGQPRPSWYPHGYLPPSSGVERELELAAQRNLIIIPFVSNPPLSVDLQSPHLALLRAALTRKDSHE
jgi:hypothetical protein